MQALRKTCVCIPMCVTVPYFTWLSGKYGRHCNLRLVTTFCTVYWHVKTVVIQFANLFMHLNNHMHVRYSMYVVLQEFNRGLFDFLIATDEAAKPEAKAAASAEAAANPEPTTSTAEAAPAADAEADAATAEEDVSHPWAAAAAAEAAEQGIAVHLDLICSSLAVMSYSSLCPTGIRQCNLDLWLNVFLSWMLHIP